MSGEKKSRKKNPNGSGTIGSRKDGRYELKLFVDTPDGRRKRVSVYGATWDEADAERTRLKELQRKGIPVDVTTMTVRQYLTYWLKTVVEPHARANTYANYETLVRLYMVPGLGNRKLRSLESRHIREWLNGLRTRCQCCAQGKDAKRSGDDPTKARCCAARPKRCCEQYPGVGTRKAILRVLRAALQDAMDEELLSRNVARKVPMPTGRQRKEKPWTEAEALRFLETAQEHRLYARCGRWRWQSVYGAVRRSGCGGWMWTWSVVRSISRRRSIGSVGPWACMR